MDLRYFADLAQVIQQIDKAQLARLRTLIRDCKGIVWIAGNGGSYANALHWSTDLAKVHKLRAVALGANAALQTAWSNDESFQSAFALEFATLANADDLLICLSCSGISPNIAQLIATAKERAAKSILVTGVVTSTPAQADHIVRVWSKDYAIIEDCTAAIGHWLTKALYERS